MFRSAATGAVLTIVLAFPVAGLFAVVSPLRGIFMFFGIIEGGFVVLAALGAAAGVVAHKIAKESGESPVAIRFGLALVIDVAAACVWAIMVD